jgi:hypothetical protein
LRVIEEVEPSPPKAQAWARPVTGGTDAGPLGERRSFEDADKPIHYRCPDLRLAASQGKISLLAGLPGAGKGPILDHLAVCFALGLKAFGRFQCEKSRVLLLDCEGWRLTMRRMARMARAMGVDRADLAGVVEVRDVGGVALLTDETYYAIEAARPEVLLLDSYTSAMMSSGLDPNKIEFAQLAQMLAALDTCVVSVAHANKDPKEGEKPTLQQVSGSGALAAMAQTGIVCWHPDGNDDKIVSVACMRAPETRFEPFDVAFRDVEGDGLATDLITKSEARRDEADEERRADAALAGRILSRLVDEPRKARAAIEKIVNKTSSSGRQEVARVLEGLVTAGFVVRESSHKANCEGEYVIAGDAPTAVVFEADGSCRAAPAGPRFRRS